MSSSSITFKDIKVIDAVCIVASVVITAIRIGLRLKSGRIWWDDAFVVLSAIFSIAMSTATGMHYGHPYAYNLPTRLAAYYLIAEGFYLTLWTARLSILFSIIRIVPEKAQRRFLQRTAIAFGAVLVFLLAQVFWVCETPKNTKWKHAPNPQCSLGLQVAVCQLITDIIADLLLIIVPVRLLTRTNLERGLKIRLVTIFGATILTTVVGLVHAAYLLEIKGVDAIVSALVEVSVCLIVCNLVVVVPAMYRAFGWRAEDREQARDGDPSFRISSFKFGLGKSTAGGTVDIGIDTAIALSTRTGMNVNAGVSEGTTEADDGEEKHVGPHIRWDDTQQTQDLPK